MKRRRLLWIVLIVVVIGGFLAWSRFAPRVVPAGQPALVALDVSTLADVRADFNRYADATRVIVLLSPT